MTVNTAGAGLGVVTLGLANDSALGSAPDTPTLTGARYSDTVLRLTVANAAGTTVTPYYATAAQVEAGTAWTAGTPRSGNGNMDITVSAGTDYYFVAIANDTQNSIPSNLVGPLNTSTGSGSTLTANMGFPRLKAQPELIDDDLAEPRIRAVYELGTLSLSDANLENGDFLPVNANKGIAASTYEIVDAKRRLVPNSSVWEAIVIAKYARDWEDSFS